MDQKGVLGVFIVELTFSWETAGFSWISLEMAKRGVLERRYDRGK
jgi:hypothetical protein